ncbi:DUF3857 domain-containing transglutaminase family protein [Echinicola shivajiensis]|uniref:DUF3857 domain-containing transglutaminase family protein n=1 Tax=Echinicola shivajiensis TaxID=1035916 RepID=UPI001BFC5836|nr:DUF3857 and transglutaminase domain-containing protein [Echinicola shivajiensis]
MINLFKWAILACLFSFLIFENTVFAQSEKEINLFNSIVEKELNLELNSDYEVLQRVKKKVTILNKDGLNDGLITIYYNDLISIEDFNGIVRDKSSGKTIDKLRLKDLNDISLISDYSVFEDSRLKYYELNAGKFPVEIEFEYTTKKKGNVNFPTWVPSGPAKQFVRKATLNLSYPESLGIRYMVQNIDQEAKVQKSEGNVALHWELENLLTLSEEKPDEDSLAMVKIAPKAFSMEGYASNLETWNGLGEWIYQLNQEKDILSPEAKSKVNELTAGVETDLEKIKVLYRYMQENYRYVSIQLGLGGLMPMSASAVFEAKYGDCKALSMFMNAMLKASGIKANYTLVKAGSDEKDIDVDFPSNQFNHVILQVPMEQDTVWLECTSNTLPAGFLGDFTMNRHVLVINEQGGNIVKTPDYQSPAFNRIKNFSQIELLNQGSAKIKQTKEMTGLAAQTYMHAKQILNEKELQKHLYKDLDFSGAHIENYDLNINTDQLVPQAVLSHETYLQQFYKSTSKRMIIQPKYQSINSGDILNRNLHWEENIEISSPEELTLEQGETDINLTEDYFDYKKLQVFEDNLLKISRVVELHFPKEVTDETISNTLKQIEKLDDQPIFLKR